MDGAAQKFFRKRSLSLVAIVLGFFILNGISAGYVGFDFLSSLTEIPSAFVWLVVNFLPTDEGLSKMSQIMSALGSTVLGSIAASTLAAVLGFFFAVLGSRSIGLGGPVTVFVRGFASLFRNIPLVAWAFILLFSFKQSEFTGFLALFFSTFGFLVRSYLETIDEVSSGSVEALRATGASYFTIVTQAVIPMTLTSIISWVLYQIEYNIRDATLVGMLTGSGIGFVFDVYFKGFRYHTAGIVIVLIALVIIACELISNYVRRRII